MEGKGRRKMGEKIRTGMVRRRGSSEWEKEVVNEGGLVGAVE